MKNSLRALSLLVAMCVMALACGTSTELETADRPDDSLVTPLVMATDAMLADVVSEIVGDAAEVVPLVRPGEDPTTSVPSARTLLRLDEADLVVTIGLGYESVDLAAAVDRASTRGTEVLELGEELDPEPYPAEVMADLTETEIEDPHVWVDPQRMATAVDLITRRLTELRAEFNTPEVLDSSEELVDDLHHLDRSFQEVIEEIPEEDRRLFSSQPVFGYLSDHFEIDYLGSVVPIVPPEAPGPDDDGDEPENEPVAAREDGEPDRDAKALGGPDGLSYGPPLSADELTERLDGLDVVITEPELDGPGVLLVLAEADVRAAPAHAAALGSQIDGSGSYLGALRTTLETIASSMGGRDVDLA
ncbi:MAG: metal ABC transporter substrate-binding protein [Actinomycetota bacterium]|nr:metal ABC transporter substrate-binding protein [Actinomycetota bacterium]